MFIKHIGNKKGFTLVETLIYIAFMVIFSGLVVQSLLVLTNGFYTLRAQRALNHSANTAIERILRETRNAYGIDYANSNFHIPPHKLVLLKKDLATGTNTTIEFSVNSAGELIVKEGGVDKGVLVGNGVQVVALSVIVLSNTILTVQVSLRLYSPETGTSVVQGIVALRGQSH
ncbi:MAG: type II secretion system protein [Patescibacteria group bacterium]